MFIDPTGRLVNYRRLRANTVYHDLCEMSNRLATISLENVTENERKTFFISKLFRFRSLTMEKSNGVSIEDLYNILTIHGITASNEIPKSILDLNQFSKTVSYKVGSYFYSLDDIEHGILRGEWPHRTSLILWNSSRQVTSRIRTVRNVISPSTILEHVIPCVEVIPVFISH